MTQTEKPMGKAQQKKQGIVNTPKKQLVIDKSPVEEPKKMTEQQEGVAENLEQKHEENENKKTAGGKTEPKKPIKTKPKEKKFDAVVNGSGLPISTKKARDTCKFIKNKTIEKAISDLEEVIAKRKPMPMKGEIPHQKGIMSGGFPKKTAEQFIQLLRSLKSNADVNEIENPIIVEAIANIASRPRGKFGRVRKKRTHVKIKCMEHRSVYPKLQNEGAKKDKSKENGKKGEKK